MARKRKSQRMFTREQRQRARREQLERAPLLSPAQVDRATITAGMGSPPTSAAQVAEAWLSYESEDPDGLTRFEVDVMAALGREFGRLAGEEVSVEAATIVLEQADDAREAENELADLARDMGVSPEWLDEREEDFDG